VNKAEAELAPYLKAEAMYALFKVTTEGEKKRNQQAEAERGGKYRPADW